MAGIFGGHLFNGVGQTPDMTFSITDPDVAASQGLTTPTGGKTGGAAYMPSTPLMPTTGGKTGGDSSAYLPPAPTTAMDTSYAAPASSNTTLYIVGGVAVVGLLAVLMMGRGRRGGTVTANRGKRGRRSRHRRSR